VAAPSAEVMGVYPSPGTRGLVSALWAFFDALVIAVVADLALKPLLPATTAATAVGLVFYAAIPLVWLARVWLGHRDRVEVRRTGITVVRPFGRPTSYAWTSISGFGIDRHRVVGVAHLGRTEAVTATVQLTNGEAVRLAPTERGLSHQAEVEQIRDELEAQLHVQRSGPVDESSLAATSTQRGVADTDRTPLPGAGQVEQDALPAGRSLAGPARAGIRFDPSRPSRSAHLAALLWGLLAVVFFVVGCGFILAAPVELVNQWRLGSQGRPIEATLVGREDVCAHYPAFRCSPEWRLTYQFVDPASERTITSTTSVNEPVYDTTELGQAITVSYVPTDPSVTAVGAPTSDYGAPVGSLLVGLLFAGVPLRAFLRRGRQRGSGVA
jgi:hypothetical protein